MLLLSVIVSLLLPSGLQPAESQDAWYENVLTLYWNGEYEQTIEILSALPLDDLSEDQRLECHKYRAFSYIALGDAEKAQSDLKGLLATDPNYAFDSAMVSPKIVEQLGLARKGLVGELLQQGKAAYYANDFDSSIRLMDRILRLDDENELALEYRQLAVEKADLTTRLAATGSGESSEDAEPEPEVDPDRIYRMSSEIAAPALVQNSAPRYPEIDARLRREGRVVLLLVVERDGAVSSAKVLRSASKSMDQAAVDAVKKWRYSPATLNGRPVRVSLVVGVDFALREQ